RNRAALFWNLAFPALFIVIFGVVFGRGTTVEFDVGVAGPESAFRDAVIAALQTSPTFVVSIGDEEEELQALANGNRGVVAVFGAEAVGSAEALPTVTLYYNATEGPVSQVAVGAVRQTLVDVAGGPPPLPIEERPVTAQDVSFMDVFVPGILAMSLMNSGVIGLATAFVTYRERGILRRIRVTPFPLTSFILARVISQLLLAAMQAVILIGMAWAFFGLHLRGNPLVLLVAIAAGAMAFLAIGFAISGIAPNTETAASYANLVTFPMLFLSGIFFSMENAPAWLRPITKVLPLPYLVDALRQPMSFGNGFSAIWLDLVALMLTFIIAMAISVRFFRWDSRPA
ncbi:MAG TPA: ABC transporter permease, partial [Thermomicrobiales bacterium]|nr:ABC transporter permease [Thermomicrobiales bacterium]